MQVPVFSEGQNQARMKRAGNRAIFLKKIRIVH